MTTQKGTTQEVQVQLPNGAVIQGHYIVESLLGKGDFGTIYLVRDQYKKQKLFILAEVFNLNEAESYHFTLEYVAPASLEDQALPRVQYVFKDDRLDRTFVFMSYIEEPTLEILRLQQPEERFPLPKVMAFMVPVTNALNYMHHQNPPVIHQTISPTNIIISRTLNAPVLIMLDLMKESDSTTTILHYFAPGYGAPEQYEKEISTRTDIYALGATCYTLLTGIIPPDALYRSTQLNNGEADPLKPLNEVMPTIPIRIAETIQQAMSINADDRFSSAQQFEHALKGNLRFQESSMLKSRFILPEQNLSLKADPVEQKPLEPMIETTNTTPTNSVKQQSPEPLIEPSVPTVQQGLMPGVPPLLAVTEKLTMHEPAPPVSEGMATIIVEREPSSPEIVPLTVVAEEPHVLDVVSLAPTQSPVIPEQALETPAKSLPKQQHTVLSRKPDTSRPLSRKRAVNKSSTASEPKQSRTWKPRLLLIVIAFIMSFGISVVLWSDISSYPVSHSPTPVQNGKATKLTSTPPSDSSVYPMLTGTYSGTLYDLSRNISTSMLLTDIKQSQGNISGYLTLGLSQQGSGHFSGTVDATKELKFVVTDTMGNATLFFEGVMQSATSLTGDYYRCSPVGLSQGSQCKQAPGSYGIWDIVLLS